jgi:hypothetical protein
VPHSIFTTVKVTTNGVSRSANEPIESARIRTCAGFIWRSASNISNLSFARNARQRQNLELSMNESVLENFMNVENARLRHFDNVLDSL